MRDAVEDVGGGVKIHVSSCHTFGTDSFLLSHFAQPRHRVGIASASPTHLADAFRVSAKPKHPWGAATLDLCTGCGVVPLLWFRDGNGPGTAHAVDIQPEAIALLHRSVDISGLTGRVIPLEADLRELRGILPMGHFDLITCNPPYKAAGTGLPSQKDSDRIARHETLCTIDDVCAAAEALLRFGGRLCLCQLPERMVDVMTSMRAHRIEPKRMRMVQQNSGDSPWLFLIEGKRGAKPFLVVEPPLIMRQGDEPSAEMAEIYRDYGRV